MTTPDRVLVVGGTGPTGVPLVRGLVDRGHQVTILHRGTHEDPETPSEVEHLHADPYDADSLREVLDQRRFDLSVVMYGRLRAVA
ncbi:MAG: NmrA family NAD(P)-binding protein [Acidimicrobiales bacterium]